MPATGASPRILSAARFVLQVAGGGQSWGFSELSGIKMEVEPTELIYCKPDGTLEHTKQYGKTKPPEVTLRKPMDDDTTLWAWHIQAQAGDPKALMECTLTAYTAGSPGIAPASADQLFSWTLINAWPMKLDLAGMKSGATETPQLTLTLTCDQIMIAST